MKTFEYSAVDADGVPQTGELQAISRQQAVNTLKTRNFIVTKLEESKQNSVNNIISNFKGVPKGEINNYTRQLGTMIVAGVPINQALRILANQASNKKFAEIISDVIQQIDGGGSLHESLAAHEQVFGRLYLSLIRAGESSGNLEVILARLATTLEADDVFKGKVKGALIYPIIIVLVMVGVLAVMFFFVIPQLADLYEDLDADLPFITQLMINFSRWLVNFWWMMILVGVGAFFGLRKMLKVESIALKVSAYMLKIPVFGTLTMEIQLTSFTRTLSMLVNPDIPLLESIDIAKETLSNLIFRNAVAEASAMVEKGKPLADAFRRHKEFPPLLSEMLSVGEQTGKVDEVLEKISQYFEQQAARKTENLATAIEPIVMVLLGVMVGFLVISLIMPIYSLTSQI